jgi:hypothetical protein
MQCVFSNRVVDKSLCTTETGRKRDINKPEDNRHTFYVQFDHDSLDNTFDHPILLS